jgi:hypothetical protein
VRQSLSKLIASKFSTSTKRENVPQASATANIKHDYLAEARAFLANKQDYEIPSDLLSPD